MGDVDYVTEECGVTEPPVNVRYLINAIRYGEQNNEASVSEVTKAITLGDLSKQVQGEMPDLTVNPMVNLCGTW